jgi:CheY-like chemotaxis protein
LNVHTVYSFILNGISQASKPGGKATVLAELKSKTNMGARGEKVTVHFTVKDDGPGLSESEIDMMFVPFSRLKPGNAKSSADKFSLSAAKQILEVSGAKVGGESAPGKGSSFYFHIDFHRPSQADEQANFLTTEILSVNEEASKVGSPVVSKPRVPEWASSQSKGATRASLSITATQVASADSSHVTREEKVSLIESTPNPAGETEPLIASKKPVALLVDDVKSNRRMYGRILELLGFDVVTADDGLECIAAVHAATEPFTLLLVDHSMVRV